MAAAFVTLSPDQQELKAAFRQLVRAFGGMDAAACATGYAQSTLSDWASAQKAAHPPMHVVAHLESCTVGQPGHPHVTRLMARRAGFVLVERQEDGADVSPLHGLAGLVAETGDLSRCIGEAMADGAMDDAERLAALRELRELEGQAAALRVALGGSKVARPAAQSKRRGRG